MTVLVPDNAAFSKLAPGVLQNITSNPELLKGMVCKMLQVFFNCKINLFKAMIKVMVVVNSVIIALCKEFERINV